MKYFENKTFEKSVLLLRIKCYIFIYYTKVRVSKTSYILSFNNTQIILENIFRIIYNCLDQFKDETV